VNWPILNIHTWDINFLSGQSVWSQTVNPRNDINWEMDNGWIYNWLYGMSFQRVIPNTPVADLTTGTQFQSINDFQGNYSGNYDGRPCELLIGVGATTEGSPGFNLNLSFHDLEEDTYFSGQTSVTTDVTQVTQEGIDPSQYHVIGLNVYLNQTDANGQPLGNNSIYWPNLSIHTWDIVYLSGVSKWNGQFYGMSFTRNS
jgi:hypothetical protein